MRFTNELFVKSFDKDVADDDEAFVRKSVLKSRKKVRIAAKLLSEYENCQEYTPRKKEKEPAHSEQIHSIQEEMKVETITEEEATKVVVSGTHDFPSAPGILYVLNPYICRCSSIRKNGNKNRAQQKRY